MGKKKKKGKDKGITPKERYDYLINARNFHYDNFNKWMTYFYIATGALFIGYYTLISSEKELIFEITTVSFLGYITSLFWHWSGKGYYYWVTNFINLINDCEKNSLKLNTEDKVYSVFYNKKLNNDYRDPIKGANISTSKVTLLFSYIVTIVWGALLISNIFSLVFRCLLECLLSTLPINQCIKHFISLIGIIIFFRLSYLITPLFNSYAKCKLFSSLEKHDELELSNEEQDK